MLRHHRPIDMGAVAPFARCSRLVRVRREDDTNEGHASGALHCRLGGLR
jgi:hypothetical protein